MLQNLSIQNYALIDQLEIDFMSGFSTITGETGAGKSILLGALSLLIGQRAEADVLLDKSRKCVVEACFEVSKYKLQPFFESNEIDYSQQIIIRREILENGRSRAFVNDTPVNLALLKELGDKLVDIHSQHQNSYLNEKSFQLRVIDILAKNQELLLQYREKFKKYNELRKELHDLVLKAEQEKKEADYLQFLFKELEQAKILPFENEELEEELKILSHAEEIKLQLSIVCQALVSDEHGVLVHLKEAGHAGNKAKSLMHKVESIAQRIESSYIELKDIASEAEKLYEAVDLDPERLEHVKQRLDLLYSLFKKHKVSSSAELILVQEQLSGRLTIINNFDNKIEELQKQISELHKLLENIAGNLSTNRKRVAPILANNVIGMLQQLGMPYAAFIVSFEKLDGLANNGIDEISYLFSANKQSAPQEIAKVASGGEISRVMLAIKSVIASSVAMPAIIFDEIDTGVSGEIADKMGSIMKEMALNMQVISITHLPQVAAKGASQYFVYKTVGENASNTRLKLLNPEERVTEIAKMLSGKDVSEAAVNNAKVLLGMRQDV